jgi:hypothetical protein
MIHFRHLRIWTAAALLAAATLTCTDKNGPSVATDIEIASGDGQNGVVGQPLPSPLTVLVTDASGDPVSGVAVQWAAQGGGRVSAASSTTGSNGRASVERVLGPDLGQQTTTATAPGLEGSPVTFVATAREAGDPASIALTSNPPVSALSAEVFDPAAQPVLEVRDVNGILLPGVQVTASLASGSGTLEGATTASTNGAGIATFTDLGIRGTGDHTLEFRAGTVTVNSGTIGVSPLPAAATTGSWGPVVNWDIVPLHMNLMPNGKIIAWGKTDVPPDTMGMPRIWDPAAGPPSTAQMIMGVDTMLFCAGHTLMPDGRLMVSGGHLQDDRGIATTFFFSPDGAAQRAPDMAHGRWYPTVTVLADGRLLTMAGRNQSNAVVTTPSSSTPASESIHAGSTSMEPHPRDEAGGSRDLRISTGSIATTGQQ